MLNDIIKFTEQKWHQNIYTYLATISLVVYIVAIAGLTVIAPEKWFEDKTLQSQANDIYPENWIKI